MGDQVRRESDSSDGSPKIAFQLVTDCYLGFKEAIGGDDNLEAICWHEENGFTNPNYDPHADRLRGLYKGLTGQLGNSKEVEVTSAEQFEKAAANFAKSGAISPTNGWLNPLSELYAAIKRGNPNYESDFCYSNSDSKRSSFSSNNEDLVARPNTYSMCEVFKNKVNQAANAFKNSPKAKVAVSTLSGTLVAMGASVGFSLLGTYLYDLHHGTEAYKSVSEFFCNNSIWDASSRLGRFNTVEGIYGSVGGGVVVLLGLMLAAWALRDRFHAKQGKTEVNDEINRESEGLLPGIDPPGRNL